MATKAFNEGTNVIATVNFRSDGAAFPPSTVHWKLTNLTADKEMVAWTSVTASDSVEISIPASKTVIQDAGNTKELLELNVTANKDLDTQIPEVIRFYIRNIR